MKTEFDISSFTDYEKVEGQYTDSFIKNNYCLKYSENEECVQLILVRGHEADDSLLSFIHPLKKIKKIYVSESQFTEFIGNVLEEKKTNLTFKNDKAIDFNLETISNDAPIINIINAICIGAIKRKASDIHVQTQKDFIAVRYRIDGVLLTVKQLNLSIAQTLISRIKVMAGLNLMENRLPQDGRISVNYEGQIIDFRVSILPSVKGYSLVLRLFNNKSYVYSLDELGFSDGNLKKIKSFIKIPYGLLLVTGPTGSGKTTTLHSMIKEMDLEHLKIVTIEDPVEREIDGVDQVQVNEEISLTFENVLRRILRQDPDVIMVGEIRDHETAELAVRAALTGHVILSTLHTNDSVSSITRLKNLGIEKYLISSVLRGCIAQRLVRKFCPECHGKGCVKCDKTGYSGRTVVSEVFEVDETVCEYINKGLTDAEILTKLKASGFKTLRNDAESKRKNKITDLKELEREALL